MKTNQILLSSANSSAIPRPTLALGFGGILALLLVTTGCRSSLTNSLEREPSLANQQHSSSTEASPTKVSQLQSVPQSNDAPVSASLTDLADAPNRLKRTSPNSRVPETTSAKRHQARAAESRSPHADQNAVALVSAEQASPRQPVRTLGADESLSDYIQGAPGVVLLDFYADWCGPCKKQGKVLHELAEDAQRANAQIIKVDIEEHRDLAKKYNVSSLPTLLVIKDGAVTNKKLGLTDRKRVLAMLQ